MGVVYDRTFRACLFQLGARRFALRLEFIREIVPMAALSQPPSMPSILEGFLNLGGVGIPVVRTAALLGLAQDGLELHTPLVIVRAGALPLALLVHRVLGVVPVSGERLLPLESRDSFNGCVEGRLAIGDEDVHLLSVDRLLLEKERRTLAELQAAETRRLRELEEVTA